MMWQNDYFESELVKTFISHKLIKKQAKEFLLEVDKVGCDWLHLACCCMLLPANKSNWEDSRDEAELTTMYTDQHLGETNLYIVSEG